MVGYLSSLPTNGPRDSVERGPRLAASGLRQNIADLIDAQVYGEFSNFRHPTLVTGQRAYAYPTVAWTTQGPAWYFTASTGVHARHYSLNDTTPTLDSQDYVIPISTLDARLRGGTDKQLLTSATRWREGAAPP